MFWNSEDSTMTVLERRSHEEPLLNYSFGTIDSDQGYLFRSLDLLVTSHILVRYSSTKNETKPHPIQNLCPKFFDNIVIVSSHSRGPATVLHIVYGSRPGAGGCNLNDFPSKLKIGIRRYTATSSTRPFTFADN